MYNPLIIHRNAKNMHTHTLALSPKIFTCGRGLDFCNKRRDDDEGRLKDMKTLGASVHFLRVEHEVRNIAKPVNFSERIEADHRR